VITFKVSQITVKDETASALITVTAGSFEHQFPITLPVNAFNEPQLKIFVKAELAKLPWDTKSVIRLINEFADRDIPLDWEPQDRSGPLEKTYLQRAGQPE